MIWSVRGVDGVNEQRISCAFLVALRSSSVAIWSLISWLDFHAPCCRFRWPSKHSLGRRAFKSEVKSAHHVVRLQNVRALGTFIRGCVALHVAGDAIYSAIKDRRSDEFVEVDG